MSVDGGREYRHFSCQSLGYCLKKSPELGGVPILLIHDLLEAFSFMKASFYDEIFLFFLFESLLYFNQSCKYLLNKFREIQG